MITRRNFCVALAGLVAAPYVIRNSGVLMPVRDRTLRLMYAINIEAECSLPIGVVYPFVNRIPEGWLPFDGRIIRREQHPELFKIAKWDRFSGIRLITNVGQPCYEGVQI